MPVSSRSAACCRSDVSTVVSATPRSRPAVAMSEVRACAEVTAAAAAVTASCASVVTASVPVTVAFGVACRGVVYEARTKAGLVPDASANETGTAPAKPTIVMTPAATPVAMIAGRRRERRSVNRRVRRAGAEDVSERIDSGFVSGVRAGVSTHRGRSCGHKTLILHAFSERYLNVTWTGCSRRRDFVRETDASIPCHHCDPAPLGAVGGAAGNLAGRRMPRPLRTAFRRGARAEASVARPVLISAPTCGSALRPNRSRGCGSADRSAVLGAHHPGELLEGLEDRVKDVGRRRVFLVDVVVHLSARADRRLESLGDEVDDLGRVDLALRELGEGRRLGDGVASSVGKGVKGAHALGDRVAEVAGGLDDLVELEVRVAEVLADDVPVRLLALARELDEVDEHALEVVAELLRRAEAGLRVLLVRQHRAALRRAAAVLRRRA